MDVAGSKHLVHEEESEFHPAGEGWCRIEGEEEDVGKEAEIGEGKWRTGGRQRCDCMLTVRIFGRPPAGASGQATSAPVY
eukprot:200134-Hanusia_phi.AAC.1